MLITIAGSLSCSDAKILILSLGLSLAAAAAALITGPDGRTREAAQILWRRSHRRYQFSADGKAVRSRSIRRRVTGRVGHDVR